MSVRLVLNNFNRGFLICGVGSIYYNQGNLMTTVMFYVLRCIYICCGFAILFGSNMWVRTIFNFFKIMLNLSGVHYLDKKLNTHL